MSQPPVGGTHYGFHSPLPVQEEILSHLSAHRPPSPPSGESLPLSSFQIPQGPRHPSVPEPSDLEDEDEDPGLDIDEQSDDEDDRQAHAHLHASPDQVAVSLPPVPQGPITTMIPHLTPTDQDHRGFAVSVVAPTDNLLVFIAKQDIGTEQSVLQNHYRRNRPPRTPLFQHVPVAPRVHPFNPNANADVLNPRNVKSYPTQWQEVISNAKRSFRPYVAGKCGFPDGADGVQEAREHLQDTCEVYREQGGTLEQGDLVSTVWRFLLTNSIRICGQ